MEAARWVIRAVERPEFTAATMRIAAFLARNADESCIVGTDASGRPLTLMVISSKLDLSQAAASRALIQLHDAGFIDWQRVSRRERLSGKPSRIRILLNAPEA